MEGKSKQKQPKKETHIRQDLEQQRKRGVEAMFLILRGYYVKFCD